MTLRASRVMKARRCGGVCPACRMTLIRGTLIALVAGRWWHAQCVVDRSRASPTRTATTSTPHPEGQTT